MDGERCNMMPKGDEGVEHVVENRGDKRFIELVIGLMYVSVCYNSN